MRASLVLLFTIVLMSGAPRLEGAEIEQQEACLEAAKAHYADLKGAAVEAMQVAASRCEASGSDEFSDRCYGIVGRKLASALDQALAQFEAEQQACLH
jgi:hypothetical protein